MALAAAIIKGLGMAEERRGVTEIAGACEERHHRDYGNAEVEGLKHFRPSGPVVATSPGSNEVVRTGNDQKIL